MGDISNGQEQGKETSDGSGQDGSDKKIRTRSTLWWYRLVGGFGIVMLAFFADSVADVPQYPWVMQTWHEAGGEVTSSTTEEEHLQVEYEYEVGGMLYRSTCGTYGCEPLDEKWGEQFDVGSRVTVHFDPSSPDRAFLAYPTPSFGAVLGFLWWVLMTGVASALLLVRMGDRENELFWKIWGRRFEELREWISSKRGAG